MLYEIPLILTIQADARPEAVEQARVISTRITELFERANRAQPITTEDHALLKRLGIDREGEPG